MVSGIIKVLVSVYQEIITFSLTITGYCSLTVCLLTAKRPTVCIIFFFF